MPDPNAAADPPTALRLVTHTTAAEWLEAVEGGSGFGPATQDRAAVEAVAGPRAAGYGEITGAGAQRLLDWLDLQPHDAFFDLGSGAGRLVIQAAACTPVGRAVGVELAPGRCAAAARNLAALHHHAPGARLTDRVALRREDIRHTSVTEATCAYLGATLFPAQLVTDTARHLAKHAPRLRHLLTTQAFELDAITRSAFVQIGSFKAEMTWSPAESVFVYARRDDSVRS